MITIQVTGYNGKPVSQSIRADFDEAGGTIGRAPENTLVLLDPERKISRTHASLARGSNGYVLRDQGSVVPVVLNGVPLGNGREAPIAAGDEIRIAGYVMSVRSANAANLEPTGTREADDRGASPPPVAPVAAKEMLPPAPDAGAAAPTVVAQAMAEPAAALPVAPSAPAVVEPTVTKATVVEQTTTEPVPAPAAPAPAAAAPAATSPAATEPAAETDADMAEPVLSWTDTEAATVEGITTVILSPTGHAFTEAESGQPDTPEPSIAHPPHSARAADSAGAAATNETPATPSAASPNEDLLRALLTGAGVRDIDIPGGLSPQLMNQLGRLLREATAGLLDLLAARAMTKREVRADMTVIVASDNNPLKFSPDMEAALTHLLVPRGRGFMPPLRAVADAYDDLRAHQLGFMAGMRSALAVVLARFDPRVLEERLTETTVVDSLLPTHRKAKLWDLFSELYGTISNDAQSDFHMLFGREFLRAYQEHVAKLPARGDAAARH